MNSTRTPWEERLRGAARARSVPSTQMDQGELQLRLKDLMNDRSKAINSPFRVR